MAGAAVVSAGWHDTYFRWDISTPQRVTSRLEAMPGQALLLGPARSFSAERDRFGKWQHLLGPEHVLLSYTVDSPRGGTIRHLEVQAHLGTPGEDDLCAPHEFESRWGRLQAFMAMLGVLPPEDPVCVRVDTAVDVTFEDTQDAQRTLEGLRYARWPGRWYAEWQGPPPYTTVAIKSGRNTVGRVYCRNTKLRNGGPRWGKLRFETERRFSWREARQVNELASDLTASNYWSGVFGPGRAAGGVKRVARETQTIELAEQVERKQITTAQFEQLTGFLDAERVGVTDRVHKPETARRRRELAKRLGISPADANECGLTLSLDDLLEVPRSTWDG